MILFDHPTIGAVASLVADTMASADLIARCVDSEDLVLASGGAQAQGDMRRSMI